MNPIQEAIRYKNMAKNREVSFGKLALGAIAFVILFFTVLIVL
jgi:hypothetical protein